LVGVVDSVQQHEDLLQLLRGLSGKRETSLRCTEALFRADYQPASSVEVQVRSTVDPFTEQRQWNLRYLGKMLSIQKPENKPEWHSSIRSVTDLIVSEHCDAFLTTIGFRKEYELSKHGSEFTWESNCIKTCVSQIIKDERKWPHWLVEVTAITSNDQKESMDDQLYALSQQLAQVVRLSKRDRKSIDNQASSA
jgi:hypothetical protein